MTAKKTIYVAGPMTRGDFVLNVRTAVEAGNRLRALGLVPYVPHLSALAEFIAPKDYEYWMSLDLDWVEKCDAVYRLPGESSGADREVARARELGKPVCYDDVGARYFAGKP